MLRRKELTSHLKAGTGGDQRPVSPPLLVVQPHLNNLSIRLGGPCGQCRNVIRPVVAAEAVQVEASDAERDRRAHPPPGRWCSGRFRHRGHPRVRNRAETSSKRCAAITNGGTPDRAAAPRCSSSREGEGLVVAVVRLGRGCRHGRDMPARRRCGEAQVRKRPAPVERLKT
jgi:hypothetical protein